MINRFFVRCTGCLEIASVDVASLPYGLKCGICGSHVENMGRVQQGDEGSRLVKDHVRCACDARCTAARGPICSCSCGGKNHGAGMAAVIRYTTDAGAVPTVSPRTPELEAAARSRYAEFSELAATLKAEETAIYTAKRAGYIARPLFDRMLQLQRVLIDARKAKTHANRMKKLQAAAGKLEVVAPVVEAVAPAAPVVVAPVAVRPATEPQKSYVRSLLRRCNQQGIETGLEPAQVDAMPFAFASLAITEMKKALEGSVAA